MIRWLLLLLGGALLGGVVHLATVIILPRTAIAGCLRATDADRTSQYGRRPAHSIAGEGDHAVHGSRVRERHMPVRSF